MTDHKTPRVLISDKMSPLAEAKFKERGIDVDYKPGMSKDELIACIGDYNGLAIRSATRPDTDVMAAAKNLKVIGRAGIGVDNVDLNSRFRRWRHCHEHAFWQLHHHRRTRDYHDAGPGAADPGCRQKHP